MDKYHSTERFQCPHCSKEIISKLNFDLHVRRVHLTTKSLQCDLCPRKFKFRSSLREHKLVTHEKIKPKTCEICGKSLTYVGYHRHMASQHGLDKPFACDLCDRAYVYQSLLVHHVKDDHGIILDLPPANPRVPGNLDESLLSLFCSDRSQN